MLQLMLDFSLNCMGWMECNEQGLTWWGAAIEAGREQQVTSYLHQWTQLIRLHGRRGVAPVQPYSCPEMWLYWRTTPPKQSDQLCYIGADMTSATSLSLSTYNLLLYGFNIQNNRSAINIYTADVSLEGFPDECHQVMLFKK